jgi:hypothetical protein
VLFRSLEREEFEVLAVKALVVEADDGIREEWRRARRPQDAP